MIMSQIKTEKLLNKNITNNKCVNIKGASA